MEIMVKRKKIENTERGRKVQRNLLYFKRYCYENSNKNSKMLAKATQSRKVENMTGALRNENGEFAMKKEKWKIFKNF